MYGDADLLVQARSALLDALDALEDHRDSVVVIHAARPPPGWRQAADDGTKVT